MSIEAEQIEDWIGAEVVNPDGERLGKVAEVYYRGLDPVIVEVRSGVIGRKLALAALAGATVSMKHLRLNHATTIPSDGGVTAEALAELVQTDPQLANVTADTVESGTQRKERILAAQQAATYATTLESDATSRRQEAEVSAKVAREAAERATAAQKASDDAAELAIKARARADNLQRTL
jgi:hypothetical protein